MKAYYFILSGQRIKAIGKTPKDALTAASLLATGIQDFNEACNGDKALKIRNQDFVMQMEPTIHSCNGN